MPNDYRRTQYDGDRPDFTGNKRQVEQMIRSDHPRIVDLHSMISMNKNGFKGNFIEAYEGKCAYCGASLQVISRTQFEVDHLIPRTDNMFKSKKDAGYMDNLILACHDCNHNKHEYRIPDDYLESLHPDKDSILDIFERNSDYYIRISKEFDSDDAVKSYYDKLRLGDELHRLDYLIMNMIGLSRQYPDDSRLAKLKTIIIKLIEKRNFGMGNGSK